MPGPFGLIPQQGPSPFAIVPVQVNFSNSNPAFDIYQNIPQLNNYQTFRPYVFQSPKYQSQPQQQQQNHYHPKHEETKRNQGQSIGQGVDNYSSPQRPQPEDPNSGQNSFIRRDGGWGYGKGNGNGYQSVGNSPAISALALLGFLFFLNLIQNSLQNNRQMLSNSMTTTTTTNTTTSTTTGSGSTTGTSTTTGRKGRERRRRGLGFENNTLTSASIPTHPIRQIEAFLFGKEDPEFPSGSILPAAKSFTLRFPQSYNNNKLQEVTSQSYPQSHPLSIGDTLRQVWSRLEDYILDENGRKQDSGFDKLRRMSIGCMRLVGCTVGTRARANSSYLGPLMEYIFGVFNRSFGQQPNWNRSWTTQLLSAWDWGWRVRGKCGQLTNQC